MRESVARRQHMIPLAMHAVADRPIKPADHFRRAMINQASGLNAFDAPALIGSTVSVAIFWLNAARSCA